MMQSSVVGVGPFHCAPSKLQPKSQVSAPGVHETAYASVPVWTSASGAAPSSVTQPANASASVHAMNSFLMIVILMRETVHPVIASMPAFGSPCFYSVGIVAYTAMFRLALCIFVLLGCGGSSAPPPTTPTRPVVTGAPEPAKPPPEAQEAQEAREAQIEAQAMFARWLDAFNEGDEAGLAAFAGHLAPELAKDFPGTNDQLDFREDTGGFDVRKTEDVRPKKYVAIVKERDDDKARLPRP
jgi:hypothetical protein